MRAVLRLVGYFLIVLVVWRILGHVPILGSIPFVGFWISILIVSWALERVGRVAVQSTRNRNLMRELGAVDSPYNHGKLGALLVGQGRYRAALPHLEQAVAGDPGATEWPYRQGCALLGLRRPAEAIAPLERVVATDEEYAYGAALLRLAEAHTAAGRPEAALEELARFERNHGEGAESSYRRGVALKKLGRADEARAAFARVRRIAAEASGFHRREAGKWALRSWLAALL